MMPEVVSAEGFVVAVKEADLSFQNSGQVIDILVVEGDTVEAGEVLIRLDNTHQQKAVAWAEADVAQADAALIGAQARLAQVMAGPSDEAIAQAETEIETAKARLAQAKTGPAAEAIAQTEAMVETAKARRGQLTAGARPEDIQVAAAELLAAHTNVRQAQSEYDKIAWAGDIGQTPEAVALEQATLAFEAAQARYDRLVNGATAEDIAVAESGIEEAEAALAAVRAGPTQEAIGVARAGVAEAEAALAVVLAGPTDEDIAIAEAGVAEAEAVLASAQAELAIAQAALSDRELVAPFGGTIARVNVEIGELVSPGRTIISLGDISRWYVETDDLSEIDVVQVAVGQPVNVTVDALLDQEFNGVVTDIAPRSETKNGDVTYTVTIELDDTDGAPLRWGLTAFVNIDVESGSPH
jgi:HlyD family secretion protein